MAPDLHIGRLQGRLGPGLTPQYTQGYTKEFRGGCFVEAGESGLVAKAAASQELAQVMGRIGGYVARRRRLHGSTRLAVPVDQKSVVKGKSVSVRVDLGCRRIIKQKKEITPTSQTK